MPRSWRECCDDIIIWVCGSSIQIYNANRESGRYTGEELEGDWFPPAQSDIHLVNAEEGRIGTGGDGEGVRREIGGIPENRCSDPKMVEGNSPASETNAVYFGGASVERRSPIDWHDDMEI